MPILEALYKELGLSKKKHTTDDMILLWKPYPVWVHAAWLPR